MPVSRAPAVEVLVGSLYLQRGDLTVFSQISLIRESWFLRCRQNRRLGAGLTDPPECFGFGYAVLLNGSPIAVSQLGSKASLLRSWKP